MGAHSYSYHIFYFPFRWSVKSDSGKVMSERVSLAHIPIMDGSMWDRIQLDHEERTVPYADKEIKEAQELFGERQYFLNFVHPVLYDIKGEQNPLVNHYERREPKEKYVSFIIDVRDRSYTLRVDSMNLNLYASGVGVLSFYLSNESESQAGEAAILDINQFGRRVFPPHSGEFDAGYRSMIASSVSIEGLNGNAADYFDSFDYRIQAVGSERGLYNVWEPSRYIVSLIHDLSSELDTVPVIDDRMLVNCWYGNDDLSRQVANACSDEKSDFIKGNFWYKYVFVDAGKTLDSDTCQNDRMKEDLLKASTYFRWQKFGTLFGVSRYSFMLLTDTGEFGSNVLGMHMRTLYSRMFELVVVQRASMLNFSAEVTKVSSLAGRSPSLVARSISSLYMEYIRFVNQVYFRSVTLQDQGMELYDMLRNQFASDEQIKDLDGEIEELHRYVMLVVDQSRNENSEKLNILAALFLPSTAIAGILGINRFCSLEKTPDFWLHVLFIALVTFLTYSIIRTKIKKR